MRKADNAVYAAKRQGRNRQNPPEREVAPEPAAVENVLCLQGHGCKPLMVNAWFFGCNLGRGG